MKNYAKVGTRKGKPAFRTPAMFRYKKYMQAKPFGAKFTLQKPNWNPSEGGH